MRQVCAIVAFVLTAASVSDVTFATYEKLQ
jgi:hypothetical protein